MTVVDRDEVRKIAQDLAPQSDVHTKMRNTTYEDSKKTIDACFCCHLKIVVLEAKALCSKLNKDPGTGPRKNAQG